MGGLCACESQWAAGSSLSAKLIDGIEPPPGSISWQIAPCVFQRVFVNLCGCEKIPGLSSY